MDLGIAGRVCVVTGGSRGIGRATARLLADEGARVLMVAREQAEPVGGESAAHAADVTDPAAADAIVAACEERFGPVDVLVNAAGTSFVRPLEELTDEDWDGQWKLHVMACRWLMQAVVPGMAERGWGRVVNVGSSSGKRPSLTNAAYTVTKAAQLSLSRVYADSYASQGVLVNAVAPGPVATGLWTAEGGLADQHARAKGVSRDEALDQQRAKIPLGRFGTDEEIANVIAFLCSERASDVAGAAWSVDGGIVPLFI
jgi:3-oxoacyl-[acyl-carrier protein] reductase